MYIHVFLFYIVLGFILPIEVVCPGGRPTSDSWISPDTQTGRVFRHDSVDMEIPDEPWVEMGSRKETQRFNAIMAYYYSVCNIDLDRENHPTEFPTLQQRKGLYTFLREQIQVNPRSLHQWLSVEKKGLAEFFNHEMPFYHETSNHIKNLLRNQPAPRRRTTRPMEVQTLVNLFTTVNQEGNDLVGLLVYAMTTYHGLRMADLVRLRFEHMSVDHVGRTISFYADRTKTGEAVIVISANRENPQLCCYTLFMKYFNSIRTDMRNSGHVIRSAEPSNFEGGLPFFPPRNAIENSREMDTICKDFLRRYPQCLPPDIQHEELTGTKAPNDQRMFTGNDNIGVNQYGCHSGRQSYGFTQSTNPYLPRDAVIKGKWKSPSCFDNNYVNPNPQWLDRRNQKLMKHFNDEVERRNRGGRTIGQGKRQIQQGNGTDTRSHSSGQVAIRPPPIPRNPRPPPCRPQRTQWAPVQRDENGNIVNDLPPMVLDDDNDEPPFDHKQRRKKKSKKIEEEEEEEVDEEETIYLKNSDARQYRTPKKRKRQEDSAAFVGRDKDGSRYVLLNGIIYKLPATPSPKRQKIDNVHSTNNNDDDTDAPGVKCTSNQSSGVSGPSKTQIPAAPVSDLLNFQFAFGPDSTGTRLSDGRERLEGTDRDVVIRKKNVNGSDYIVTGDTYTLGMSDKNLPWDKDLWKDWNGGSSGGGGGVC